MVESLFSFKETYREEREAMKREGEKSEEPL